MTFLIIYSLMFLLVFEKKNGRYCRFFNGFLLQHFLIHVTSIFNESLFNMFSHFMGNNFLFQNFGMYICATIRTDVKKRLNNK